MNRYEQRKQKRLLAPEVAEGYREMTLELQHLQDSAGLGNDFAEHGSVHDSKGDLREKQGEDACILQEENATKKRFA